MIECLPDELKNLYLHRERDLKPNTMYWLVHRTRSLLNRHQSYFKITDLTFLKIEKKPYKYLNFKTSNLNYPVRGIEGADLFSEKFRTKYICKTEYDAKVLTDYLNFMELS